MEEDIKNNKTVAKLTLATILSIICCIALIIVAAGKPDSPMFCAECHSMESSFNTWKDTVACNTGCLGCHTHDNSGRTLSSEIIDNNCTKSNCHTVEKLNSKTSKYMEKMPFKHETHLKEFATNLKLKCIGCHSYTGKEVNEEGKIKHFGIDENACFVCHFTKSSTPLLADKENNDIGKCLLCHKDVQAKIKIYDKKFDHLKYEKVLKVECTNCHFEMVHGNGDTNKKDCYYCHTKVPDDYTDTERMHNDHVKEHKVPCSPCHEDIHHKWNNEFIYDVLPHRTLDVQNKYKMRGLNADKDIGIDTELDSLSVSKKGRNVFDKGPYFLQREIYRGVSGSGIVGSPDPMYLATVSCIACHNGEDFTVDPKTCNSCHEKGFDKTMMEQIEYVKNMLTKLSNLIMDLEEQGVPKYRIDGIKRNYNLIVADGSYGVHNIKYIKDLITYSIDRLVLIQRDEFPEIVWETIPVVLPEEDDDEETLVEGSWGETETGPETEAQTRSRDTSKIQASKKIELKLPTEVSISEAETKSLPEKTSDNKLPTARRTHTVSHGDTLWELSLKYYNDPSKWVKIYNANEDSIEYMNSLKIGQELIIPE